MHPDLSTAAWRKSAYSGGEGGNCVELAVTPQVIGVRDSKNTEGDVLTFSPRAAAAFMAAVKGGRVGD
ncbi:MAG: hypothetical protein K0Q93_3033 [Nocardioidaceae bacterium]|jgi:hypothetical protein|nr:hypothetical protein [Nocardioidaceae bacterium]